MNRYIKNGNGWIILLLAIILPGSGYVLMGKPLRGLIFAFWIIIFAYITFHLSSPETSVVGRLSGGIAVWMLSILEIYKFIKQKKLKDI